MIPYSRQQVTEEDIDAVVEVLKSDYLTQGPVVKQFEEAVANYCGANFCVATSSATAALHVACLSLDITEKDCVWVSALSFVASANCARYCGAAVDFVDVDSATGLISTKELEAKLLIAQQQNRLPKALVVVHMAGQSCDMKPIFDLCQPLSIKIIEDASHALGGHYQDQPVGSCRYSDVCVFSFHPVKPITAGEGGGLTTNNSEFARKARLYASHGIEREEARFKNASLGPWYYEQQLLGYNYRMSDIHAALGLSQLKRLDNMVSERRQLAKNYVEELNQFPVTFLKTDHNASSWHLLIILVPAELRKQLFVALREAGFFVNLHYLPIPQHPYYAQLGFNLEDFPIANAFSESAISLPLFSGMDLDVIRQLKLVLSKVFD